MRILIVLILKADLLLYCLIVLIIFKRQIRVVFITAITWCSCALEASYFPFLFLSQNIAAADCHKILKK